MEVTKVRKEDLLYKDVPAETAVTDADLRNEYGFMVSEKVLKNALKKGIITPDELQRLRLRFLDIFSPYEARIFPKTLDK